MELRHFRYFIAVAEKLHFAHAAEALGIAAPTLTVQIQQIERSLGARLLSRTKRSVALTTAGEAFLAEARLAVQQFERAQQVGRRAGRGELGRISLGYVGSAVYAGVVQEQLRAFRQSWPDVLVDAEELPMVQLPDLVEEGRIDIAFVRSPVHLTGSLRMQVLLNDRFCAAFPADHPLAATVGPIKAKAMAGETFIVPEQDSGTIEIAHRGRFNPRVGSAPGSLVAVLAQVSLGAGIAIVPDILMTAVNMPNVVFRAIAGNPVMSGIAAVYRAREHSAVAQNFVRQLIRTSAVAPGRSSRG